jgi:hypothetical protein
MNKTSPHSSAILADNLNANLTPPGSSNKSNGSWRTLSWSIKKLCTGKWPFVILVPSAGLWSAYAIAPAHRRERPKSSASRPFIGITIAVSYRDVRTPRYQWNIWFSSLRRLESVPKYQMRATRLRDTKGRALRADRSHVAPTRRSCYAYIQFCSPLPFNRRL